jgi:hypothetical protein
MGAPTSRRGRLTERFRPSSYPSSRVRHKKRRPRSYGMRCPAPNAAVGSLGLLRRCGNLSQNHGVFCARGYRFFFGVLLPWKGRLIGTFVNGQIKRCVP